MPLIRIQLPSSLAKTFKANDKRTISEHIQNIFKEGVLSKESVVRNFRTTAADSKNYQVMHYNLDVIISVGYRVSSHNKLRETGEMNQEELDRYSRKSHKGFSFR